jgi:hypothetical protein
VQGERLRLAREHRVERMIGAHDEIGGDHAPCVAFQPALQTIGEKAHARKRRHRQHERQQQHGQLARAPVACAHARGKPHEIGPA